MHALASRSAAYGFGIATAYAGRGPSGGPERAIRPLAWPDARRPGPRRDRARRRLLGALTLVALVVRRVRLPLSVALVIFGLIVAAFAPSRSPSRRSWSSWRSCPASCSRPRSAHLATCADVRLDRLLAVPGVVISGRGRVVAELATGLPLPSGCGGRHRLGDGPGRGRGDHARRRGAPPTRDPRRGREPLQRRHRHRAVRDRRRGGQAGTTRSAASGPSGRDRLERRHRGVG